MSDCKHNGDWIYGTGKGTVCEQCGKDSVLVIGELQRQLAESINDRVNLTKRCNNIAVELAENKTYINTWLEKIEALQASEDG